MIWFFVHAFGNVGFLVIGEVFYGSKELALANVPEAKNILDNGAYLLGVSVLKLGSMVLADQVFRMDAVRSPSFTISPVPLFDTVVSDYDLGPKDIYLI